MTEAKRPALANAASRIFFLLSATLAVLLVPDLLRFGRPFWAVVHSWQAPTLALVFLAAVGFSALGGTHRFWRLLAAGTVLLLAGLGVMTVTRLVPITLPRSAALVSLGLAAAMVLLGEIASTPWQRTASGVLALAIAAAPIALSVANAGVETLPPPRLLITNYEILELKHHGLQVDPADVHRGGALEQVGDEVLAMTGSGALHVLRHDPVTGRIRGERLPIPSPVDFTRFDPSLVLPASVETVRALSVLSRPANEGYQLFVAHHGYSEAGRCVTVQLSRATISADLLRLLDDWEVIFETAPCLPFADSENAENFAGLFSGGQLQWLSERELLLTIGDHGHDMLGRPTPAAQLDDWDYGKVRVIDAETGAMRPFTKGNRNPQGLVVTNTGQIWETEHGPKGGDELNLLVEGNNYGWPYETFGTGYSVFEWPPSAKRPEGAEYTLPHYSWVPSIGVTAVIQMQGNSIPGWQNDLVVVSLSKRLLFHIRLDGDRVVFAERIEIGEEMRDVLEGPDGALWLWTDRGMLMTLSPTPGARAVLALGECTRCHATEPGKQTGAAPSLVGIVNRPVAGDPRYPNYTPALQAVGGVWTPERLDRFLADPREFAPGTAMPFRVESQEARDSILSYLSRL